MARTITKQEKTTTVSILDQILDLPIGSIIKVDRLVSPLVIQKAGAHIFRSTADSTFTGITAGKVFGQEELRALLSLSGQRDRAIWHVAEDGFKPLATITVVDQEGTVSATDQVLALPNESLVKIVGHPSTAASVNLTYFLHRTGPTGWRTTRDLPGLSGKSGSYLAKPDVRAALSGLEDRGATFEVVDEGQR